MPAARGTVSIVMTLRDVRSALRNDSAHPASAPPSPMGWLERALLGLLVAASGALMAAHFHPFLAPNNDYASFEHVARSFAEFELPTSFKRGPILPAVMALVSPAAGSNAPFLQAALLINAAASLINIVLVHRIARYFGGPATAGFTAILFVGSVQFFPMALQPLVEPTLGTCVLAAVLAMLQGSRWAYGLAAAAVLGRPETALLIPLITITRIRPSVVETLRASESVPKASGGRRAMQAAISGALGEAGFAVLALAPLALWMMLGSTLGTTDDTYLAMLRGMDFATAPSYFERSVREPFMGWYRSGDVLRWLIIGLPTGVGAIAAIRRSGWGAGVLFGLWILSMFAIVRFGVDKARYVYPTSWIPMMAYALGLATLGSWLGDRLRRREPWIGVVLALALFAAWSDRTWNGLERVSSTQLPDISFSGGFGFYAFGGLLIILTGLWSLLAPDPHRSPAVPPRVVLTLMVLFFASPLLLGGIHGAQRSLTKVGYDNYGSALAADWLDENLESGERALMLIPEHAGHVAGLGSDRVSSFAELGIVTRDSSEMPSAITAAMDAAGLQYAVYTWRSPISTPSSAYYFDLYRTDLSEVFQSGQDVDGFEHVTTLEYPDGVDAVSERRPVQIYRRVGGSGR